MFTFHFYIDTQMRTTTFILLLLTAIGCSGNVHLSGTVSYSDDQSPVTGGVVVFEKGGQMSQGEIRANGTYTVFTLGKNDGMPRGDYVVYLTNTDKVEPRFRPDGTADRHVTPLVHSKYRDPGTSGLTFKADGKTKKFDITVDRAK